MADTVIICSKEDDVHAIKVAGLLRERYNKEVFIFDTSTFPGSVSLTGKFNSSRPETFVLKTGAQNVALQDVSAIWWRRPQPMIIDSRIADQQARDFAF